MKYIKLSLIILSLSATFQMQAFYLTIGDQRENETNKEKQFYPEQILHGLLNNKTRWQPKIKEGEEVAIGKQIFRVSQEKIQPIDHLDKDRVSDLKLLITEKKFQDSYQLLKKLGQLNQQVHLAYLLSEVSFDYLISKKTGKYNVVAPRQVSGNFLIKQRNIRDFFYYVCKETKNNPNNKGINLPELKELKRCFESVFSKNIKYRFTIRKFLKAKKLRPGILHY